MDSNSKVYAIAILLNTLLKNDPKVAALLNQSIPGTPQICNGVVPCRPTVDGQKLTICGIICAIGRIVGEPEGLELQSLWDSDGNGNWTLSGFRVGGRDRG